MIKNLRKQEFLCTVDSRRSYLVFYEKQAVVSGNKYVHDP